MPIQQMLLGTGSGGPEPPGQVVFDTPGTTTWTVPNGVTSVSVVCIGAGNAGGASSGLHPGGGGALAYGNNIPTTPGATINLQVGEMVHTNEDTWFSASNVLFAGGGNSNTTAGTASGSYLTAGNSGGIRGAGYSSWGNKYGGGGGGAGGYTGAGGTGGDATSGAGNAGAGDAAGGGGASDTTGGDTGPAGGGGGGSGLFGTQGNASNGAARTTSGAGGSNSGGLVGSGGKAGQGGDGQGSVGHNTVSRNPRDYGGGAGSLSSGSNHATYVASGGAIRIIWPGNTRSFPSNCADV